MALDADAKRKDGQAPPDWARRTDVRPSGWQAGGPAGPRVTIVGPCAAGKTTLVTRLQAHGYDAHAVAQEHSGVPYLWQLSEPDLLVFLDVDLATTAARRQREWPAALHDTQQSRLAHARAHADLYLDSSALTPDAVAERVAGFIQEVARSVGSKV
ncbi:MAG TPA: hypothetical protein VFU78_12245 [Thermomicrobiales bacterium]|nr:hypothetical protein [Thermomicrobiales bacterium]